MDTSFQDLFSVLTRSENLLYEEQKKIKKVKEDIDNISVQLQQENNSITETTRRIQILEKKRISSYTDTKSLKFQEEILSESKTKLKMEMEELNNQLKTVQDDNQSILLTFMKNTSSFCQQFGLGNGSQKTRFLMANKKTQDLHLKKQDLDNEIVNLEEKLKELESTKERSDHVDTCFTNVSKKIEDLRCDSEREEAELRHLEHQTEQLKNTESDPRFVDLQSQLEACSPSVLSLEFKAAGLKHETEDLTLQLQHRERQQATQQHREWARNRQRFFKGADN